MSNLSALTPTESLEVFCYHSLKNFPSRIRIPKHCGISGGWRLCQFQLSKQKTGIIELGKQTFSCKNSGSATYYVTLEKLLSVSYSIKWEIRRPHGVVRRTRTKVYRHFHRICRTVRRVQKIVTTNS